MMWQNVALDVLRESASSRYITVLFAVLVAGILTLSFALDLEVVEGALAAGRLFGQEVGGGIRPIDIALRPVFQGLAHLVFYLGILFGIVSTADVAPRLWSPGRVELLLSLPVKRWEVVFGTFVGVMSISILAAMFAVGGISGVLFFKGGFATIAPLAGSLVAVIGFMSVYSAMLLASSFFRSATLSAGVGLFVYLVALMTSDRENFLSWFRDGGIRDVLEILIAPLPPLNALADLGAGVAGGEIPPLMDGLMAVGVTLAFSIAMLLLTSFVVAEKDY